MTVRSASFLLLLLGVSLAAQGQKIAPDRDDVMKPFSAEDRQNFLSPAKINYPETWFHFIDGNVEKEGITKDLEAIAGAGISGVQFFHGGNFGGGWPGVNEHIYCLSEKWEDILTYTASEAKRLGLRFTMQNCPGWSMAGGPWITPENSMRVLACCRTDVKGGEEVRCTLPLDSSMYGPDRDYRDLFVLAFRKLADDGAGCLKPSQVISDTASEQLLSILSAGEGQVSFPADRTEEFDVVFPKDTVVRTIVMNKPNEFLYGRSVEPGISLKVESVGNGGERVTVLELPVPAGVWQDPAPSMSFAMDESRTSRLHVTISHKYTMALSRLHFLSGARKNSWESEAGWDLRRISYEAEYPKQSPKAFIPEGDVADLTSCMDAEGRFVWNAPSGEWTVLRIGHASSCRKNGPAPKEAAGWECSKLSPEGAEAHFDGYIGKYGSGAVKGLLSGMLLDSWECGTQTWTRGMEDRFRENTGYELRKWIPALFGYVIGDHRTTFRFLRDWRYTTNNLLVKNFYGKMAEKAKAMGLYVQYETAGGDVLPIDIMEYYKYADVPMTEFWHNLMTDEHVGSINYKPIRPAASAGHVYGKTRVSAEAFTSGWLRWNEHFWQLKENANRNLAQGVSHLVFHTYTHNPKADSLKPGTSFGSGIGTPFLRGQTWWKFMPAFTDYTARCTYMLERGIPSMDVLWYLGDDVNAKPDQRPDYMPGYNYDYCNRDVLMNRISVRDGRLVTPEGLSYAVMWYPSARAVTAETVHRLLELVKDGAVLVMDRPFEYASLMPYDKAAFESDCRELFGDGGTVREVGKGRVYSGTGIVEALHGEGLGEDLISGGVDWMHRKTDGADWYFVAAPKGKGYKGPLEFRSEGRVELWNPVTGTAEEIPSVRKDGRTVIDADMQRAECFFVVFDHSSKPGRVRKHETMADIDLSGGWNVSFPEGWGMPASLNMDTLAAWKDMDVSDEGRAFSGTAVYSKEFYLDRIESDCKYVLRLGDVDMIAKVTVNGKESAPLWTFPFDVDVTSALVAGKNSVKVEVTSGWFNRMVYDAGLEEPSLRRTWTISGPSKDSPLVPSGLMGPVTLSVLRQ